MSNIIPDDWRKAISFTDRLSETAKIAAAYKTANPACPDPEASKYARISEEKARKAALSQKEYHELCAKTTRLLLSSAESREPVVDRHVEEHVFPNLPSTGARIGKYTNAEQFNNGIFSEIFRAADPESTSSRGTPNVVALKVTTPAIEQPPHNSRREARLLDAAKGDNIIPLIETFQQPGGHLVLVFPHMSYDLNMLLHGEKLSPQSQKGILRDLFKGLAHLHTLKIIHRDIKPSNILLATPSGPAHIADFGTAWSDSDPASEPTDEKITDVGTTCYRPPELLFGSSSYTEKLDMWAAGCVAAQIMCLNGQTLFDAGDLGSELALIKSILDKLGTPDGTSWPEANSLPDWGKMNFARYDAKPWDDILPGADKLEMDLVASLVVYESARRMSSAEALQHAYLQ